MVCTLIDDKDDFDFILMLNAITRNLAARTGVQTVTLVKIDNWFAPKWRGFSGKVLGALGQWRKPLRIPPFVPRRIRIQQTFRTPAFDDTPRPLLHIWMDSESQMRRKFTDVAPDAAVIWYSGATVPNGRGALMTYVRERVDPYGWYAGWVKKETWLPTQLRGISRTEVMSLAEPIRRTQS